MSLSAFRQQQRTTCSPMVDSIPAPRRQTERRWRAGNGSSLQQPSGYFDIEVDCFQKLFLGNALVRSVGHVDGSRTEQQGLAPIGECWDVSRESGDHGWEIIDLPHPHKGNFEGEVDVGQSCDSLLDGLTGGCGIFNQIAPEFVRPRGRI